MPVHREFQNRTRKALIHSKVKGVVIQVPLLKSDGDHPVKASVTQLIRHPRFQPRKIIDKPTVNSRPERALLCRNAD